MFPFSFPLSSRWILLVVVVVVAVAAGVMVATTGDDEEPQPQPQAPAPDTDEQPSDHETAAVDFMTPPDGHDVEPVGDIEFADTTTVTAFFPGQANLQWLSEDVDDYDHPVAGEGTRTSHPGGALTAGCAECHTEDGPGPVPQQLGEQLVEQPEGVDDKIGWVDVDVQAAFDDDYLYLRTAWESQRPRAGVTHQTFQYLNGEWQQNTSGKDSERSAPEQLEEDELFDYEDRLAVKIAPEGQDIRAFGDEGPTFDEVGCAVGCHASLRNMPEKPDAGDVQAHDYLGDDGLGRSDLRHYLLHTRDEQHRFDADGAWAAIDADYDAAADREDEQFLDLWQYRGARSAPMYGASNDYVMEYRHSGEGGDNYWFNQDPSTQGDDADELDYDADDHIWRDGDGDQIDVADYAWMYDSDDTGFHALPSDAIDEEQREITADFAADYPLITQGPDRNAVPLDPEVIDDGDLLTRRVLRYGTDLRARTNAFSRWDPETNRYTVVFRSPLQGAESDLDARALHDGDNLTAAIAVFDDHSSNRFHHISFPMTIGPDDDADVEARDLRD